MTDERKAEIVKYCIDHPNESYELIARRFGISAQEAYDICIECL